MEELDPRLLGQSTPPPQPSVGGRLTGIALLVLAAVMCGGGVVQGVTEGGVRGAAQGGAMAAFGLLFGALGLSVTATGIRPQVFGDYDHRLWRMRMAVTGLSGTLRRARTVLLWGALGLLVVSLAFGIGTR